MVDVVDAATRSRMMAGIRAKNTAPEMILRRRLHAAGLRFRLHGASLPGKPDIVLPSRRLAIFVHGCFWHRHQGCHWCSTPASNASFWKTKFDRNMARDTEAVTALRLAGWRVATVWECGLRAAEIDVTVEQLLDWVRTGSGDFESALVRPRADHVPQAG